MMRRGKPASTDGQVRGRIRDAISIHDRPSDIETRATIGHWEGDLMAGAGNSHVATLVEHRSRFTILVNIEGKDTTSVVTALIRPFKTLPTGLMTSLTWDRGMELASREVFSAATDVKMYFCDPQSPLHRGTNENTNGLLRQYFPRGMNLSLFSRSALDGIASTLNTRPRKCRGYSTPLAQFISPVASTS
jgi:IS30 family transposase